MFPEILLQSVVQLAIGLIFACTLGLLTLLVREGLGLNKQPVEHMYEFDKAELRTGGWQYYDDFFNKMEDFRNDFSGK